MSEKIPATVRNSVWIKYIGNDKGLSKCFCCGYQDIDRGNYECGHVISRSKGGSTNINNLRPICSLCNKSMGTQNMFEFQKKYGFNFNIPITNIKIKKECLKCKKKFTQKTLEKYNGICGKCNKKSSFSNILLNFISKK